MTTAILAPELVFASGNVYAPEEEELRAQDAMQDAFFSYFEKAYGGSVNRIGRFGDPTTTVQQSSAGSPSSYEDFRKVEAKVGNDEWVDYHRPNVKLVTLYPAFKSSSTGFVVTSTTVGGGQYSGSTSSILATLGSVADTDYVVMFITTANMANPYASGNVHSSVMKTQVVTSLGLGGIPNLLYSNTQNDSILVTIHVYTGAKNIAIGTPVIKSGAGYPYTPNNQLAASVNSICLYVIADGTGSGITSTPSGLTARTALTGRVEYTFETKVAAGAKLDPTFNLASPSANMYEFNRVYIYA